VIDLHCHALPGVDDGPGVRDEALALLRVAAAAGARTVVATPHCSARYPTRPETIEAAVRALAADAAAAGIDVKLLAGAEVTAEMATTLDDADLRRLTLGDSRCLLLESPLSPAGPGLERAVAALQERGYRVLLAHPERCPSFLDRPQRLRALVDGGALCSITAASLTGDFGEAARWYALELLRDGLVHSVDSDAHHATLRPPGLTPGLHAAMAVLPALDGRIEQLTTGVPAALLADEPLPAP
jgi:protein-tyrosine phosphatase